MDGSSCTQSPMLEITILRTSSEQSLRSGVVQRSGAQRTITLARLPSQRPAAPNYIRSVQAACRSTPMAGRLALAQAPRGKLLT